MPLLPSASMASHILPLSHHLYPEAAPSVPPILPSLRIPTFSRTFAPELPTSTLNSTCSEAFSFANHPRP